MCAKVLVVEDEEALRQLLSYNLSKEGFSVALSADGDEALMALDEEKPDLVLLDWMLPNVSGVEICRQLRARSETRDIPVIMLTARGEEEDRIRGLEQGADDYVTKPFSPRELVARVGVILKRTAKQAPQPDKAIIVKQGCLTLDMEQRLVTVEKSAVNVTHIEFNIIMSLMTKPRMVHTREQILNTAYDNNIHVSDRTIDSHIRNIRHKMAQHGSINVIETVHGTGFRLGPCTIETDGPE